MPLNCPNILSSGACSDSQCRFEHDIHACDACNYVARNLADYNTHIKSNKHKRAATHGVPQPYYCPACKCTVVNSMIWKQHIKGRKHLGMAQNSNIEPSIVLPVESHTFCSICQMSVLKHLWDTHLLSARHMRSQQYSTFKAAQGAPEKDADSAKDPINQNGVTIQGDPDFGIVEPTKGASGVTISLGISCTVPLAKIVLVSAKLSSSQDRRDRSPFSVSVPGPDNRLSRNPIVVNLRFSQKFIGRYHETIELHFEDERLNSTFSINITARAIVGDPIVHEELKAQTPYVRQIPNLLREPEIQVVEGKAPPSLNAIPYATELAKADIPNHLLSALKQLSPDPKDFEKNVASIRIGFLPKVFNSETHGHYFKNLIWVEEHQMEQDLGRYDLENSTLKRRKKYYYLAVPGLAENRPSVLVGDRILVRKVEDRVGHWYAGHVHIVKKSEVGLVFHESFKGWKFYQKYYVRFKLNRIPLRRQHQALDTVFTENRILFPHSSNLPMVPLPEPPLRIANELISTNPAQLQAVSAVVAAPPGSLPFIVFGPPGTGKTITIVEAIIQLVQKNPNTRILACTPSNSAADLITLCLSQTLDAEQLFRLYAPSRPKEQVPVALENFVYYRNNGKSRPCFSIPSMETMKRYRVIVSTLISTSILFGIGMPRGHFSHIFIDEAGQATEPETFVPIKTMAGSYTNVVLSGDPKQLGPVIRSRITTELGLERSYLERLILRPAYNLITGRGRSITKLVKNFRSHEAILSFPNKMFYNNDLQTCGNPNTISAYLNSEHLPNGKFPIIFHSVFGQDEQEASSPSFFNIDEATQVRIYVEELKRDREFKTTDEDIGIISPYHAQCLKIRNALRGIADEIKIGSVEEFQGQERKVIIISTVRSTQELIEHDIKHTLGFVASPRRLNVSITRAQALLIVIGDPNILGQDSLWKSFLNYIYLNGGWRGPNMSWGPSEPA